MQTAEVVKNLLTHHGVKGMRWGVRRKATVGPEQVIVRDSRFPGSKRLKTSGGRGHPAHPEAIRARTIGQVGKKSGVKALSNRELEEYSQRLRLEQGIQRLNYNDKNIGHKFVLTLLGQTGKTTAQSVANEVASTQVKKHLGKKLGLAAAAAAA